MEKPCLHGASGRWAPARLSSPGAPPPFPRGSSILSLPPPVSATPGRQPELGEQAAHMPPSLAAWSPGQPPASLRVSCYGESHQVFHRLVTLCVGCTRSSPHVWPHLPSQVRSREQGSRWHPLQGERRWGQRQRVFPLPRLKEASRKPTGL